MKKRKQSPTLMAYNKLRRLKKGLCQGKNTKIGVKRAAKDYVEKAVKSGQTKKEATDKANRILRGACSMSARVSGKKRINNYKK